MLWEYKRIGFCMLSTASLKAVRFFPCWIYMKLSCTESDHWSINVSIAYTEWQQSRISDWSLSHQLSPFLFNWRCQDWTWGFLHNKQMLYHFLVSMMIPMTAPTPGLHILQHVSVINHCHGLLLPKPNWAIQSQESHLSTYFVHSYFLSFFNFHQEN